MQGFDTLVLNPEWISQGVYKIINWVHEQKKHEIALADFRSVFKDKDYVVRYPESQNTFLFKLMIQYELAFETKNGKRLIIPHLLHEDRPAELPIFDIGESLMLRYKAEQPLPPDTISRFIVQRNEDIQKVNGEYKVWRYGVVLENEKGDIALVREDDRTISISVKGPGKTTYLDELRQTLNEIFESYKSDKPEMQYRIVEYGEKNLVRDEPSWLPGAKILNHLNAGVPYYDDKLGKFIDLPKMVTVYNIHANNIVGGHIGNIEMTNTKKNESSDESVKKENELLKDILIAKEIRKWQQSAYRLIFLIIIILIFFYFQLFHDTWEYNYVQKLVDVIDHNPSETKRNLMWVVNGGLIGSLVPMGISCYNKLFSNDKKIEKEKSIRENMSTKRERIQ
jgi:hypothetical protein